MIIVAPVKFDSHLCAECRGSVTLSKYFDAGVVDAESEGVGPVGVGMEVIHVHYNLNRGRLAPFASTCRHHLQDTTKILVANFHDVIFFQFNFRAQDQRNNMMESRSTSAATSSSQGSSLAPASPAGMRILNVNLGILGHIDSGKTSLGTFSNDAMTFVWLRLFDINASENFLNVVISSVS
jgi:hypothetical protein